MTTDSRETLTIGLRNVYALEGQALSTVENIYARLEHYPELKTANSLNDPSQ